MADLLFGEANSVTQDVEMGDEPTGLPQPVENILCFGHDAVEKDLLERFNKSRLPHAMIFSGPVGIGKSTFAYRLARFLLTQSHDDGGFGSLMADVIEDPKTLEVSVESSVVKRISARAHADLFVIGRHYDEKKKKMTNNIKVNDVRKIAPFLQKTASEGGWRMVIVDDAHLLNRSSQNALLKILEEPPPKTVLVLIADQIGRFLPTIRSRCQSFDFKPLAKHLFEKALHLHAPDLSSADIARLNRLAQGRLGYAIEILEQDGLSVEDMVLNVFTQLPNFKKLDMMALSEKVGAKDSQFHLFMQMLETHLSRLTRMAVMGADEQERTSEDKRFLDLYTGKEILTCYDEIKRIYAQCVTSHLDKKQAILEALWALEQNNDR